ncbi:hypothetical protein [Caulobacter sp. FWC2]|uniref:hypothetical protein n=1 Tax=Caulobacter sp. FWC2 TaxID=69664 RepID=UPI000C15E918|nr:hypothetical protein [Caulobacter sp. FWC2]PIB93828.1 hypothetical protein CSW62_20965 [Caulobacter sp. FWC2]
MHAHFQLVVLIGWLLITSVCFAAWRWGEQAERLGGMLVFGVSVSFALADQLPSRELTRGAYLLLDGALALGLLVLALRFARAWVGVAVLLQAVQFSLHAYYLVAGKRYDNFYAMVNNLVSLGVLLSLAAGTVLVWTRRRKATAEAK